MAKFELLSFSVDTHNNEATFSLNHGVEIKTKLNTKLESLVFEEVIVNMMGGLPMDSKKMLEV